MPSYGWLTTTRYNGVFGLSWGMRQINKLKIPLRGIALGSIPQKYRYYRATK